MARLDRLGPAREVIQIAAVLGGDFSYELLHAVHPIADPDLQRALRSLTDAELLYVRGIAPEATYQFKHALIRYAAYEALLKSRRKELHLIVARAVDAQFPAFKEAHPEVLARHWTEAGDGTRAVLYLRLAGEQAATRASHAEAIAYFSQALESLDKLPGPIDQTGRCSLLFALGREQRRAGEPLKSRETLLRTSDLARTQEATELLVGAGLELTRLAFTVGLPAAPAPRLLEESLSMLGEEDSPLKARTLSGLARALAITGDLQAIRYGEQAVAVCRRLEAPELLLEGLSGMVPALSLRPEDAEQRLACANEMLALADAATIWDENLDAIADAFAWKICCSLDFGDMSGIDAAFEAWERRAEDMQEPFVDTLLQCYRATVALMLGEFAESERHAERAFAIGQRLQAENAPGVFGQQMFAFAPGARPAYGGGTRRTVLCSGKRGSGYLASWLGADLQ
jgi:hypothetical protein